MLNINYGHNKVIMGKCRRLKEYAELIAVIREKLAEGMPLREAVTKSVDECINHNILRDILVKNRSEVIGMILTGFDQEEYEKTLRDESYQDGMEAGKREGRREGVSSVIRKMLENGMSYGEIASCTGIAEDVVRQAEAEERDPAEDE